MGEFVAAPLPLSHSCLEDTGLLAMDVLFGGLLEIALTGRTKGGFFLSGRDDTTLPITKEVDVFICKALNTNKHPPKSGRILGFLFFPLFFPLSLFLFPLSKGAWRSDHIFDTFFGGLALFGGGIQHLFGQNYWEWAAGKWHILFSLDLFGKSLRGAWAAGTDFGKRNRLWVNKAPFCR